MYARKHKFNQNKPIKTIKTEILITCAQDRGMCCHSAAQHSVYTRSRAGVLDVQHGIVVLLVVHFGRGATYILARGGSSRGSPAASYSAAAS